MRKEVEALRQARIVYAARSDAAGSGGALDLAMAVTDACHVMSRLIRAGMVLPGDWNELADADLRPASLTGPDGRLLRSGLKMRIEARVVAVATAQASSKQATVSLLMVQGYLDDAVSLIIELAAYRQAYEVMAGGVVDYRRRLPFLKWVPAPGSTVSVLDKSFRTRPPVEVLEEALAEVEHAKAKIKWARARIKLDAKAGAPGQKARSRDRRLSPSEVSSMFRSKALYLRLRRAMPGPDLFPKGGRTAPAASSTEEPSDA